MLESESNSKKFANRPSETHVLFIGELFGGYTWFSKENIIGVYKELKDRIENGIDIPSAIIFMGELIPKIPEYITKGAYNKTRPLLVRSHDIAVVAMKPHLVRIANLFKKHNPETQIIYVMGYSDRYSEGSYHDLIVKEYNFNPAQIGKTLIAYKKKISAHETIIKNSEALLEKELANGNNDKNHEQKINNLKEKIRQHKEESADYIAIAELLKQLFELWLEEHFTTIEDLENFRKILNPEMDPMLDELISEFIIRNVSVDEVQKRYEEVSKLLLSVDKSKEPKKYEQLDRYSKDLANMLKRISAREVSKQHEQAWFEIHKTAEAGELFTHNLPGSKKLDELSWEIAEAIVKTYIRNAFGRRLTIEILENNINDIKIMVNTKTKKTIRVSAIPSNTSEIYYVDPLKKINEIVHFDKDPAEIVAVSHSITAEVKADTTYNNPSGNGKIVYEVAVPPLIDFDRVKKTQNQGIKTPLTQAIKNKGITSGIIEAIIDKNSVSFMIYTDQYLKQKYKETIVEEGQLLRQRLKQLKRNNQNGNSGLPEETKIQIKNKLPSEMNNNLLLIAEQSMPEELRPYLKGTYNTDENKVEQNLKVLMAADTHIGTQGYGIPSLIAIKGLVNYVKAHNIQADILFLGGDNIEGNYLGIKNELNPESSISNVDNFEKYLEEKGISKERKAKLIKEYKAYLLYKQPINNIEEQKKVLANAVAELVEASHAKTVVIVSGQHTNKTYKDKIHDEAEAIKQTLKGYVSVPIFAISGGDMGSGNISLEDGTKIYIAHRLEAEKLNLDRNYLAALGGDEHIHKGKAFRTLEGHTIVSVTGATSSVLTKFPQQIGIPSSQSTRGFTFLDLTYLRRKEESEPEKFRLELINLERLEKEGYIRIPKEIKEFEQNMLYLKY